MLLCFKSKFLELEKNRGGKTAHDSNFPTNTPKKHLIGFVHSFIHSCIHARSSHSIPQLFIKHLLCSKYSARHRGRNKVERHSNPCPCGSDIKAFFWNARMNQTWFLPWSSYKLVETKVTIKQNWIILRGLCFWGQELMNGSYRFSLFPGSANSINTNIRHALVASVLNPPLTPLPFVAQHLPRLAYGRSPLFFSLLVLLELVH